MLQLAADGNMPELIKYQHRPEVNTPQFLLTLQNAIMSPPLTSFDDAQTYYFSNSFKKMTTNQIIRNGVLSNSVIGYIVMNDILMERMYLLDNMLNINLLLTMLLDNPQIFDRLYPIVAYLLALGGDRIPLLVQLFHHKSNDIQHVIDLTPGDAVMDYILNISIAYLSDLPDYVKIIGLIVGITVSVTDDTLLELVKYVNDYQIILNALRRYQLTPYSIERDQLLQLLEGDLLLKYDYLIHGGSVDDLEYIDNQQVIDMDISDNEGEHRDNEGEHRDNEGEHRDNEGEHRDNEGEHRDNEGEHPFRY